MKNNEKLLRQVFTAEYPAKISYHEKAGAILSLLGQNHSYTILNYNRERKNPIPFDQWTRIIIDNTKKRIWIRVADKDPEKSFNRQYNAVEKLKLYLAGYKIKFNTSQNELQEYYERRNI